MRETQTVTLSARYPEIVVRMKGTTQHAQGVAVRRKSPNHANDLARNLSHTSARRRAKAQRKWGANWGAGLRQRNRLTALEVKSAKTGKLQDGAGLILDRNATGGKWTFRYSFAGQRREMGLGGYPAVSLSDARKARDKWESVLQSGTDPVAERARRVEAERLEISRNDPTFADATAAVFDMVKSSLRGEGDRGRWLSPLTIHVLPKIGKTRVSQLHQTDIVAALKPIWRAKHPTAAKALSRIGIVLDRAVLMGMRPSPGITDMARLLLGHVTPAPTPIAATPWQAAPALYARFGETVSHLALRFALLTACRTESVRGAMFDEIDGDVWTVPADRMKGREGKAQPFRVPLSGAALEVVRLCRERAVNDYLFASYVNRPVTENALIKALNDMGEAGRPHGFRTTFRTWVQDTQAASWDVGEVALAHKLGGKTAQAYARSDLLDLRRPVMQAWGLFVGGGCG